MGPGTYRYSVPNLLLVTGVPECYPATRNYYTVKFTQNQQEFNASNTLTTKLGALDITFKQIQHDTIRDAILTCARKLS